MTVRLRALALVLLAVFARPALSARALEVGPETAVIAGIVVNGREVATEELFRADGTLWIPLEPLAGWTYSEVRTVEAQVQFVTPLGMALVNDEELREFDGQRYVSVAFLETRLGARVVFDEAQGALVVQLAWSEPAAAAEPGRVLKPDVKAPGSSLSLLRQDLYYDYSQSDGRTSSSTTVAGRLAGGRFRLRLDSDLENYTLLSEAVWVKDLGRARLLLGHQNVSLNPLLPSSSLSGAQVAWTNRPETLFPVSTDGRELLPRQMRSTTTIRGQGPIGGVAELRVDGVFRQRVTVGLSGIYEFLDVELPGRTSTRVEVYTFSRDNLLVPTGVQSKTVATSDYLLPAGTWTLLGGAGAAGNLGSELLGNDRGGKGAVGFVQARRGISKGLGVELSARADEGGWQVVGGVDAVLREAVTVSLFAGTGKDGSGYRGEAGWFTPRLRLSAFSTVREEGFMGPSSPRNAEHYGEALVRPLPWLEVGAAARSWSNAEDGFDWVRPVLSARPFPWLMLRAWPVFDGEYRLDLFAQLGRKVTLSSYYQGYFSGEVSSVLDPRHRVSLGTELGGDRAPRVSVVARRQGVRSFRADVGLGAIWSDGKVGVLASAFYPLTAGLFLRGEYESVQLSRAKGTPASPRVLVGLSANFGYVGNRFLPTDSSPWSTGRGGLAGRIRLEAGDAAMDADLTGIAVRVNDRVAARTLGGGSFYVGDLSEGVHRVELDDERLPIELVPVRNVILVEVVAGAVTRVDFPVQVELSVAGRVSCASGEPARGASIEAVDGEGRVVGRAESDDYGLYRLDGIRPGSYTLRGVAAGSAGPPATRAVTVIDDFLFEVDVTVDCPAAARPPADAEAEVAPGQGVR